MSFILPNLIIAGVNKAGTTSLFTYLKLHPDVCATKTKELHFFTPIRKGLPIPPVETYASYFEHCRNARYVMEATPAYFTGGMSIAEAVKAYTPQAKIIVLLRNPVQRVFSFYSYKKTRGQLPQDLTFTQYLDAALDAAQDNTTSERIFVRGIAEGRYADFLMAWSECFGKTFKVIFTEHLKTDRDAVLRELSAWLGIDPEAFPYESMSIENKTLGTKNIQLQRLAYAVNIGAERFWRSNPRLKRLIRKAYRTINSKPLDESVSEDDRARLATYFAPHNQELRQQLEALGYSRLPHWLSE